MARCNKVLARRSVRGRKTGACRIPRQIFRFLLVRPCSPTPIYIQMSGGSMCVPAAVQIRHLRLQTGGRGPKSKTSTYRHRVYVDLVEILIAKYRRNGRFITTLARFPHFHSVKIDDVWFMSTILFETISFGIFIQKNYFRKLLNIERRPRWKNLDRTRVRTQDLRFCSIWHIQLHGFVTDLQLKQSLI